MFEWKLLNALFSVIAFFFNTKLLRQQATCVSSSLLNTWYIQY